MVHAFGIALSYAAGNRQCIVDGALTKRLQAGQAASSGVFAAVLAREGFTGAQHVFAGRYGFFPMYQPEGYDLQELTHGLGSVFRGEEISFKPYPCGRRRMPRWTWPSPSTSSSTWPPRTRGKALPRSS